MRITPQQRETIRKGIEDALWDAMYKWDATRYYALNEEDFDRLHDLRLELGRIVVEIGKMR
jgi:hypothetical protein